MTLRGRDESGNFRTNVAMEYPPQLCEALATMMVAAVSGTPLSEIIEIENQDARASLPKHVKVRAPELHPDWVQSSRWRTIVKGVWQQEEHINLLEMRTLLMAARHLGRSHRNWDTKHLIFSDSAVCIGALGKGRSC